MAKTESADHLDAAKARFRDHSHLNVDVRLSSLLDMTFSEDDSFRDGKISLTIVADGAVISGQVVSEDVWAENHAAAIEPGNKEFADALRQVQEIAVDARKARNEELEETPDQIRPFRTKLHFGKATIIVGAANVNTEGLRVDLKHVTAWTLGEMNAQKSR